MKNILICIIAALLYQMVHAQPSNLELSTYSNETNITALQSITLKNGFHIPSGNNVVLSIQQEPNIVSTPSSNQNYILTRTFRVPVKSSELGQVRTVGEENHTVQYFDGLGRPVQSIEVMASPGHRDIVQHIEYDGFGRESQRYLPYAEQTSSDGSYRSSAKTSQSDYYKSTGWDSHVKKTEHPYAVTVFENSPLDRVLEQGSPGGVWQPASSRTANGGRTVVTEYGTNVTGDVRLWNVTANGADGTAYYLPGRLYRTVTRDENWVSGNAGTVEEYRDFEGRVVLKRVWESESKKLETQYVYDDFGDLRYVVPPAVTQNSFTEASGDAVFDRYIYAYHYDGRRRLAEKKVPGRGWEHIVYNRNDLPILTQDAVQRAAGQWSYTKYDVFGRVTETGIHMAGYADQVAAQTVSDSHATSTGKHWEGRTD